MFTTAQLTIDRCHQLALQSEQPGEVTRRYLSPPMHGVHKLIGRWMRDAGMSVRVDDAGNLIGRFGGENKPLLLIGSHLDTVPNAGHYDGILGVMVGLAVVESIRSDSLPIAIEVIGFSEEEGARYAQPYLGSHAIAGSFDFSWLDRLDVDGVTMRAAIHAYGLDPDRIMEAEYDPAHVIGFIEPHLEQGPVLEKLGLPVGVVSSIVGQSRLAVQFIGEAGHAGTTPMILRRDALVGAAKWIGLVQQLGRRIEGLTATVGRITASPNASNVIPALVELSLDVRHHSDSVRSHAVNELLTAGRNVATDDNLQFIIEQRNESNSVAVSPRLESLLSDSIAKHGIEPLKLVSGAGHDAVVMGQSFPMAMLFIRHPRGISHHPDEHVDVADVAMAIDVLVDFVRRLSVQEQNK